MRYGFVFVLIRKKLYGNVSRDALELDGKRESVNTPRTRNLYLCPLQQSKYLYFGQGKTMGSNNVRQFV